MTWLGEMLLPWGTVVDVDWHLQRGFTMTVRSFDSGVMVRVMEAQAAGERILVRDARICGEFTVVKAEPDEIVLRLVRQVP